MAQAQKVLEKSKAAGKPARTITKVGIIGAGQMGSGIAHVVAIAGYKVSIHDLKRELYDKGLDAISTNMGRQIAKGLLNEAGKEKALGQISFAGKLEDFGDCDLIIEAATEDEDLKHRIFAALSPHLKPTAILASNTSSMPEVVGEAAILVDPFSEKEIAAAMMQLVENEQLRTDLI